VLHPQFKWRWINAKVAKINAKSVLLELMQAVNPCNTNVEGEAVLSLSTMTIFSASTTLL